MRFILLPLMAFALVGAVTPETRFAITLPSRLSPNATGRLLLFAEPATPANAVTDQVDIADPGSAKVSVAAREIAGFGPSHTVTIDTQDLAYPAGFATLAPGEYRIQAVLDRDGSYAYNGRGPGDLVSRVTTVRLPLTNVPTLTLDHAVQPATGQFYTAGLPPRAAEQIAASRAHLHDERIASAELTRFRGLPQTIAAWVLTPPGYDPKASRTYPTVYTAGGFGTTHKDDGQILSKTWHLMETGAIPPMIWVALDYAAPTGTTEFADSVNDGPWGEALIRDVIPALERRYRMDAKASGRFLTGHSSGGWFALWTLVQHPTMFGGCWATSPDPVDFDSFTGIDLYASGANMYRDASGAPRPMERDHGAAQVTIEQSSNLDAVLARNGDGGQLRSFEWVFSPKGPDGSPTKLYDRQSGAVDPTVAAYWRDHYDIAHVIATGWPRLRRAIDGKIHLRVGDQDSFYLDGAVHGLDAVLHKLGARAQIEYVPNATHSMAEVYTQDEDRDGYWKNMTSAMYATARPHAVAAKP